MFGLTKVSRVQQTLRGNDCLSSSSRSRTVIPSGEKLGTDEARVGKGATGTWDV